jgi:parallel beta-helix repeat protein
VAIASGGMSGVGGILFSSGAWNNSLKRNSITTDVNGFGDDGIYYGYGLGYSVINGVPQNEPEYYTNDVDASNTVNGKPIYYWIGESDRTVPSDASCVILANCTSIKVQNLVLTSNLDGVQLAYSQNCTVTGNQIRNNGRGIQLLCSSYNRIEGNNIASNQEGIRLDQRSETTGMSPTSEGVTTLYPSTGNIIAANNITSNQQGISMSSSYSGRSSELPTTVSGNTFYRNNFLNNTKQVNTPTIFGDQQIGSNTWDNGAEGNHWSDYDGTDADGDGIGDSAYTIEAAKNAGGREYETVIAWEDRFPLTNPYSTATTNQP